jgi:N-acylglucosamine-6-phosphate 2-epimerase
MLDVALCVQSRCAVLYIIQNLLTMVSSEFSAIKAIHRGLVVSCQAPTDSPLHEPSVIAAIAQAASNQGAVGIRIDTPTHIQAVRKRVTVPIIGLWKRPFDSSEVYITPQFIHAQAIADAGADIIAVDGTSRPRPDGETLSDLIKKIHDRLNTPVMADIDTLESAMAAVEAGADLIGTTLYGYTPQTQNFTPPGWDLLSQIVHRLDCPALCEGGVASPLMARNALDLGAYAVVVGTAITGIDAQVKAYVEHLTDHL